MGRLSLSQPTAARLVTARQVVSETMRHESAASLFNEPVDAEALGLDDYFDIVKSPMDLGTIMQRLDSGLESNWSKSFYKDPSEVLRDVNHVWDNCYLYNSRPEDEEVRDMCQEAQQYFNTLWKSSGLGEPIAVTTRKARAKEPPSPPMEYTEEDLPSDLPLRRLDNYCVARAGESSRLVPLHALSQAGGRGQAGGLVAWGKALPVIGGSSPPVDVRLSECVDWCIDYSDPPGIWL
eukprot:CAMPEP_0117697012 /NCGR_PEP_ID=MMETSP0804-20121206/28992_1 /TAXON_ID=1074897 /ORGANISM="Tetraselmis astigmatica, Strain CCMP880" /LENGTH=235 /DNA_ID=CAMNT_0005511215 /DNA_START=124 /DNA_END=828 /DNA_ORIENTATION=+